MGQNTNIEWCDSTINPTSGCDGCELFQPGHQEKAVCYASHLHTGRLAKSLPDKYAADFSEVRMIPGRMRQAANWKDLRGAVRAEKPWLNGRPRFIFVGDMGDFLSDAVTDDYIVGEIFDAILSPAGRRHVWCLLTKRPERLARISREYFPLPDNCIAMTTVTNQATAELRVPELLKVQCRWRGLSCEPLRGAVDLTADGLSCGPCPVCSDGSRAEWDTGANACRRCEGTGRANGVLIDWVIAGGESGTGARPMHPEWARSLRDQCRVVGVPFFFKQWGEWAPGHNGKLPMQTLAPGVIVTRFGKRYLGRALDGRKWNGMPEISMP